MSEKYLVTGGCGFIGSHIANVLNKRGDAVRVLDCAEKSNLDDGIEFVHGDIRAEGDAAFAMQGVDVVLHQAAITSVPRSVENPRYTNDCNVGGTVNLLTAAKDAGVRLFVYASSSSVYGKQRNPKEEWMIPRPLSPYAVSKYAAECYCRSFEAVYGLRAIILRYFNVYGPGQRHGSPYSAVIANFLSAASNGGQAVIYGDGLQTRDFTYVDDVARANLLACDSKVSRCFNVGTGKATSVLELLEMVKEATGRSIAVRHEAQRKGEPRESLAATQEIEDALGFSASVDLESGLRSTWEWINSQ